MKKAPYEFALDALDPLELQMKPMFGAHAICLGHKVLMIQRKKTGADPDTGIWFGIPDQFISEIKKEFPIFKDLTLFGASPTPWQVIRESDPDFKKAVLRICKLILNEDQRIGRVPVPKVSGKPKLVIPKKIKVKK